MELPRGRARRVGAVARWRSRATAGTPYYSGGVRTWTSAAWAWVALFLRRSGPPRRVAQAVVNRRPGSPYTGFTLAAANGPS